MNLYLVFVFVSGIKVNFTDGDVGLASSSRGRSWIKAPGKAERLSSPMSSPGDA